jgi:hypothetical protein
VYTIIRLAWGYEAAAGKGRTLFVFETTASKVDNLDLGLGRVCKQDVFGLQITVDDPMALEQNQRAKHLLGEASNELEREPTEVIALDELIKVHAQELSRDAQMTTEVETLREVDQRVFLLRVLRQLARVNQ